MIGIRDRGVLLVVIFWVEVSLVYLFAALRFYTRTCLVRFAGSDDYLVILAAFLFTVYAALITLCAQYGMGQSTRDVPPENYEPFAKYHFFALLQIAITAIGTKAAVAAFLLRIVVERWHRVFLWACIGTMALVSTLAVVAALLRCDPIQMAWDPLQRHPCAFDIRPFIKLASVWVTLEDFALAIFPWTVLWNINMRRKDRLVTAFSLSLGAIGGICNIFRAIHVDDLFDSPDKTYDLLQLDLWSASEITTSIICCTVPVLRPFYRKFGKSITTDPDTRSNDTPNYINTADPAHEELSTIRVDWRSQSTPTTTKTHDDDEELYDMAVFLKR